MAKLNAIWVDGTNVRAQNDGYFTTHSMTGRAARFSGHTAIGTQGEWFQWSMPTPVIVDGVRATVNKVFVMYQTIGTAKVMAVHVYDAAVRIATFENLNFSGDHFNQIDNCNAWAIQQPHSMLYGLGISVLVDFGPPSKIGVPEIQFFTAGADFYTP